MSKREVQKFQIKNPHAAGIDVGLLVQDSLFSGAGFPFQSGAFIRKISATCPGALCNGLFQ